VLNIRNLRTFVTVARAGGVSESSRLIRRAQSAITRSIKELEADIGVQLFERRSQGMLLTGFGSAFLTRIEKAFAEMETVRGAFKTASIQESILDKAPIFTLSISRRRILVFIELVEQRHIGAVADSLGISQPAASQALREIEASVGVKLFIREPKGMQPTPLGALLGMHMRRALAEVRAGELEVCALRGAIAGRVVVGTLSLGRTRLLPRAIVQLVKKHPNLTVTTIEGSFEHLATQLRAGDVDFILGALRSPEHTLGFLREVVAHDVLSVIVGKLHPFAKKRRVTMSDLVSVDWVLPPHGSPTRELLEGTLKLRGLNEARVVVETADLAITRGVLVDSNMVTAVSAHLFQEQIREKTLVVLPVKMPETRRPIGILQRTSSTPSPAAQLLMANIRAIGQL